MVDKIKISGIAVREGLSRNGRKYISKELEKFAPSLRGRPILKDHEGLTDKTIGKIEEVTIVEGGKEIHYSGWVKEDGSGIVERIKDGRISEVSIGAMAGKLVKEKEADTYVIPKDMIALELSTTPVPGVDGTSLNIAGEKNKIDLSEEAIKTMIENYEKEHKSRSNSNLKENQKEVNMESETQKVKESTDINQDELKQMKEELNSLKKEKEKLESARKQDAILRYNEKAEAKGLKAKDLSEASMETIKALTEMVDELPEAEEAEEEAEEAPAEDKEDEEAEEPAEEAEPQSKEAEGEESEETEALKDYVVEASEFGGLAFYKYY